MKEKQFDINGDGLSIRARIMSEGNLRTFDRVILCTHGFGSSKDVANITRFAEKELAKHGSDAVLAFDWPGHGRDSRKKLEISVCMNYLDQVISYIKDTLQAKYIYNYSVSFGGYLTLRYLVDKGNPVTSIVLRAPGLRMHDLMLKNVEEADRGRLEKGREVEVGFERKMKIDRSIFDELAAVDVRKYEYFDWADDMLVIHGTKDEMVPFEDSRQFCDNNVIELFAVEGADHSFRNPQYMDMAIHRVIEFFSPENVKE